MQVIPEAIYTFCTFFDSHFLIRGLALYESLRRHCASFTLFVLCMDRTCYDILRGMGLPGMVLIALEDFEKGDDSLLGAKENRSRVEYYFTCTPSLPLYILRHFSSLKQITYLDADLFFFANPSPVYEEIGHHSIALIPHRFSEGLRRMEERGIYNVGFLFFRRDSDGLAFLEWWRNKCLEWCFDRVEGDRFADQKYLDRVPDLFHGVTIINHKGANLAPWNVGNHRIRCNHQSVWVDDQPLIFYHFHGFRPITRWLYDPNLTVYKTSLTEEIKRGIYQPYVETLSSLSSGFQLDQCTDALHVGVRYQFENEKPFRRLWVRLNRLVVLMRLILSRRFMLRINGRLL
jgi:hypothetical protein